MLLFNLIFLTRHVVRRRFLSPFSYPKRQESRRKEQDFMRGSASDTEDISPAISRSQSLISQALFVSCAAEILAQGHGFRRGSASDAGRYLPHQLTQSILDFSSAFRILRGRNSGAGAWFQATARRNGPIKVNLPFQDGPQKQGFSGLTGKRCPAKKIPLPFIISYVIMAKCAKAHGTVSAERALPAAFYEYGDYPK